MPEKEKAPRAPKNLLLEMVILAVAICLPVLFDRPSKSPRANHQKGGCGRDDKDEEGPTLVTEKQRQNNARYTANPEQDWPREHSEKLVRFNGGLLAATVGLVILGGMQFWGLYASQRGFLHLESLSLKSLPVGGKPTAWAGIRNSGKSTAFVSNGNVSWKFLSRNIELPKVPEYFAGDAGDSLSGPFVPEETIGVEWISGLDVKSATQQLVDDIKSGDVLIYIYGYITYRDTFKLFSHTSKFCGVYDAKTPLSDNQFSRCKNKNYEGAD